MRKTLPALFFNACCILSLSGVSSLTIITNDGQQFTYTNKEEIAALRQSETINNLISDFKDQDDIVIPLPVIDAPCWHNIKQCLDLQHAEKNLVDFLGKLDRDNLYAFINGINYLNNTDLLDNALEEYLNNHALDIFEEGDSMCQFNEHMKELLQEKLKKNLYLQCAADKQKPVAYKKLSGHSASVTSICYSPDGNFIASASDDRTVRIWDIRTGNLVKLTGHPSQVTSVCYSPDGNFIVSASHTYVRIWNSKTGNLVHTLNGHSDCVTSVCYSPDGNFIASASDDHTVCIWDSRTGSIVCTLTGHSDLVNSIRYSPDGNFITSASYDGTVIIWSSQTGNCVQTLTHPRLANSACYSPDGNFIASATADGTVRIWNSKTGNFVNTVTSLPNWVTSICYSPDGNFIASASDDSTVRIWDSRTGNLVHTLIGHSRCVNLACYSPDGNFIASASDDHTVRIWIMGSLDTLIKMSNPTQRLLLALAFKKKKNNQPLILDKPHLRKLFSAFDNNNQDMLKHIFSVQSLTHNKQHST